MTNQPNQTPLDFISEAFWEDYTQGRPIDGGVAYEKQLRQIKLDCSIGSLKLIDLFLMNIRKELQGKLTSSGKKLSPQQQQALMLNDDSFRRLLMFIGFYSGRVLAGIWKAQCYWYGVQELKKINPAYAVDNDFSKSIGIRFVSQEKLHHLDNTKVSQIDNPWLFLALEPVIMRLFGGVDYQIKSLQGKPQVADGLYRAVMQRLPEQVAAQIKQKEQQNLAKIQIKSSTLNNPVESSTLNSVGNLKSTQSNTTQSNTTHLNGSKENQNLQSQLSSAAITHNIKPSNTNTQLVSSTPNHSLQIDKNYGELLADLEQIDVIQTVGTEQYLKAKTVMKKFDEHVQKQNLPISEVKFSEEHVKSRNQALIMMKQSAEIGNTSAMLHYASYLMTGKWVTKNQAQAMSFIQTAANSKDSRAMRLLSKLHYQGAGVSQDNQLGKYWLEQAANHGHTEAKIVSNQMEMSQLMINEYKDDMSTDKRYVILIGATLLVGLIVFIVL